jgi:two-component system chemotaxis sensor kinase CheA
MDIGPDVFLDDYFAECDEHLANARRQLLALEAAGAAPGAERSYLDELFRSFHSIKGISGMVELREAEQLAHDMESYLRALRQRDTLLSGEGIDALIEGTQRLEQVIAARSRSAELPAIDELTARLAALTPTAPASTNAHAATQRPSDADTAATRYRVRFAPSRELADRGIGVDAVRRRLAERAEILEAAPQVGDGGVIQFVFIVAAPEPSALEAIRELGAEFEELPAPPAPPAEPVRQDEAASFPSAAPVAGAAASAHYVRVDLARLDDLMRNVGDLVISRARLADSLARVEARVPASEWRAVQENAGTIDRQLRVLREGIMRVRLVPVGEIFHRMPLVVRDLARSFGRRVELELSGHSTEIDKYLIERMMDPVLHLVRNAIAHGIESPEERVAAGKPAHGTIRLSAAAAGELVTIEVADDGRGIDAGQVVQAAHRAGVPVPAGTPDPATLLSILCAPGFSTREEADRAAGRGVGMSVVKTTVDALSGTLSLDTVPGQGSRFTLQLPLTLAITDALIARVGPQVFAVPQGSVREVLEVSEAAVRSVERAEVIPHRDAALPIMRLGRMFGIETAGLDRFHVFVTGRDSAALGFAVDRIIGQREIVVRPIADPLVRVEGIVGATDLGDGRVVLILDTAALSRIGRAGGVMRAPSASLAAPGPVHTRH